MAAVLGWELSHPGGTPIVHLLAAAPAIGCAGSGRRTCMVFGGVCATLALVPLGFPDRDREQGWETRIGTAVAILAVVAAGYLTTGRRLRLLHELERTRAVADAAQRALLRPLPRCVAGLTVAARHTSATRGAAVGGDLYEVLATRHGVRIVIGDVRGHGLPAVATVAALVGCFREAAHDEPELPGLLRRLERSLNRHLLERSRDEPAGADSRAPSAGAGSDPYGPVTEDFVTLLLLQIDVGGELTAVNCGHPWPYRLDPDPVSGARSVPVSGPEPLPPLGLFPLPEEIAPVRCLPLEPGQALFLHTDGAEDARDASGEFFPLHCTLAFAAGDGARGDGIVPRSVVDEVHAALMRHTGGRLTDDVALMTVRNDGRPVPAQAARGHTAPERTVRSAAD